MLVAACALVPTGPGPKELYSFYSSASHSLVTPLSPERSQASVEQCKLNHKTMIALVHFCGIYHGRSNCFHETQKITFLGTKVLYYDSLTESGGIVFDLGKTINLTADPRQKSSWRNLASTPGASLAAFATASLNGDRLNLWVYYRMTDDRTGRIVAVGGKSMTFRACSDSCEVLDYVRYFGDGNPMAGENQRLTDQSCYFQ